MDYYSQGLATTNCCTSVGELLLYTSTVYNDDVANCAPPPEETLQLTMS